MATLGRPELRFLAPTVYWGDLYVSEDAGATFSRRPVRTSDSDELAVLDLRVDRASDTLYALAEGAGLVVSEDYGETFRVLAPDPSGGTFSHLALDPARSGRMVAVVSSDESAGALEFWRSNDAGGTWKKTTSPLVAQEFPFVSVGWTDPPTLYGSGWDGGVFRSRDGGASFEWIAEGRLFLGPADPNVLYRAVDPPDGDASFVSFSLSTDGGDTFSALLAPAEVRQTPDGEPPRNPLGVRALMSDPRDPEKLTLLTDLGFFDARPGAEASPLSLGVPLYSGGGRVTRSGHDELLTDAYTPYLWLDPRDTEHLLLVANGALLESQDGGRRFTPQVATSSLELVPGSASVAQDQAHHVFGVDAADGNVFYVWGHSTLLVSDDAGEHFRAPALDGRVVLGLDELSPSTLYAAQDPAAPAGDCERSRSLDRGETWSCLGRAASAEPLNRFATHPGDPNVIYGWSSSGFFRSEDAGATWAPGDVFPAESGVMVTLISLLISPSDPDRLFAVAQRESRPAEEGLFTSHDQGRSWVEVSQPRVRPTLVDPRSSEILYGPGPTVSTDGGLTFRTLGAAGPNDELTRILLSPADPRVAYAITRNTGLYRLADTGLVP